MRMDLKVWVDGVQRVVCGVTEFTTCQEVVIALAQAIGRTGRYTLIEKWRETERHIAPSESPVVSLNKWGQFAGDVQLILHRSGPSASERQVSGLLSARVLSRQSLPPLAKLRPAAECALKRCEPKRKSLAGRARSLREIFGKRKTTDGSQQPCRDIGGRRTECEGSACDLGRLVQLQKDKLQVLENLLLGFETVLDEDRALEVLMLEQQVRKNNTEIEEEEFWQDEFQMELESEQLLRLQLEQLQHQLLDCEQKLSEHLVYIQKMEEEVQQENGPGQTVSEEEVAPRPDSVWAELEIQNQHAAHLEVSLRSLEDQLCQTSCLLQEKEQELELLTKELRRVNLRQFIQKTDTRVAVVVAGEDTHTVKSRNLCCGSGPEVDSGSLDRMSMSRPVLTDPSVLKCSTSSPRHPAGVYV
ncbi:ras association domain-containing protein 8-like isoform X1 [Synchiropus splendidus]|uniref:ras association domain-containing protein 8-like isoform X1 n=1 Tax=Synchiropus splendidus TaxID=270530 RepID=UPI00237E1B51|nr:ras association domain-containing protein 8-like isoform X1 [Synchiropus splendidus]